MRIFYRTKENEVKCIDTIDTPLFLSCRQVEVDFLRNADEEDTDSFFIQNDSGMTDEEIQEFVKQVYVANAALYPTEEDEELPKE